MITLLQIEFHGLRKVNLLKRETGIDVFHDINDNLLFFRSSTARWQIFQVSDMSLKTLNRKRMLHKEWTGLNKRRFAYCTYSTRSHTN